MYTQLIHYCISLYGNRAQAETLKNLKDCIKS